LSGQEIPCPVRQGKVDYHVESYPQPDESSPYPYTIFEKTSVFRLARKFHALFDRGRLITALKAIESQVNPVRILTPYLRRRASFVWPGNSMPFSKRGKLITALRAIQSQMNPVRILTPYFFNPLSPELNSICYLLALLAHHFLHVSRIRVKSLTLR